MSKRKFESNSLVKDERVPMKFEKKSLEKFGQAQVALSEANASLSSHVIVKPDYVETTRNINFPSGITRLDPLNTACSVLAICIFGLIIPLSMVIGLLETRELLVIISLFGLAIPGSLRALAIEYNGGGTRTVNQPIRRFLSRFFLSKKEKALMKRRVQEREFYYLALEARKALAGKLIDDMRQQGHEKSLQEFKMKESFQENSFHQLEFDEDKGLIVLEKYTDEECTEEEKSQLELKSESPNKTNMKSLLALTEDMKKISDNP